MTIEEKLAKLEDCIMNNINIINMVVPQLNLSNKTKDDIRNMLFVSPRGSYKTSRIELIFLDYVLRSEIALHLLCINEDIRFHFKDGVHTRIDDFDMIDFIQSWESTTLNFEGIGGQAITECRTYVFIPRNNNEDCIVYFNDRYAYSVPYTTTFMYDVERQQVESQFNIYKYLGAVKEVETPRYEKSFVKNRCKECNENIKNKSKN